jgi:hypothetical protein
MCRSIFQDEKGPRRIGAALSLDLADEPFFQIRYALCEVQVVLFKVLNSLLSLWFPLSSDVGC